MPGAYGARYASTAWAKNTPALNKPRIAATASIMLTHLATVGNAVIAGLCFKTTSSGRKNGFVEPLAKSQWLNSSSY